MSSTTLAAVTTLPRAELAPRLAAYAAIHDAMARDVRRLAVVVATADEEQGPALRRWWDLFELNIEHHHVKEDDLVFPLVVEHEPTFDPAELVADHEELDTMMAALRGHLDDLATGRRDLGELRADLVFNVAGFGAHLEDHLGREEHVVFPVLTDRLTDDEYADLEKGVGEDLPLRALSFTLPWVLDDADPALVANAEIPGLLRFLDRWFWQRSYRRLAAPLHTA